MYKFYNPLLQFLPEDVDLLPKHVKSSCMWMICDFSINCVFVCGFDLWSIQSVMYWVNMVNKKPVSGGGEIQNTPTRQAQFSKFSGKI
jgi:hypothetical protein